MKSSIVTAYGGGEAFQFLLALAITASVFVLFGCERNKPSGACAPFQDVTRVVIHRGQAEDEVLTDVAQIRRLVEFANNRRDVSRPSLYTMPAPSITATFYKKADYVGSIGAGSTFLFVSCSRWKGVRKATDAELQQFQSLIDGK